MNQSNNYSIYKDVINRHQSYLAKHRALVSELGDKAFGVKYPSHDADKVLGNDLTDEDHVLTMALRNVYLDGELDANSSLLRKFDIAVGKHLKMNSHHPEYWDDTITASDYLELNPPRVNCIMMPESALDEMVCDWTAVALKKNRPITEWFYASTDRFRFSPSQRMYILNRLKELYHAVCRYNIRYPGFKYDADNVNLLGDLCLDLKSTTL